MRRLVLLSALSPWTSTFAATPEEQKVLDAYLRGSADPAKEAAVVKLLDARPALAPRQEVLVGLEQSSVEGDPGARGRKLAELALARGADPNGKDKDGTPCSSSTACSPASRRWEFSWLERTRRPASVPRCAENSP